MTREEDLIRIAKKLDKMVTRNNTVRIYFDTHRWRVVPTSCCTEGPWTSLLEMFLLRFTLHYVWFRLYRCNNSTFCIWNMSLNVLQQMINRCLALLCRALWNKFCQLFDNFWNFLQFDVIKVTRSTESKQSDHWARSFVNVCVFACIRACVLWTANRTLYHGANHGVQSALEGFKRQCSSILLKK